jgi:hypothetical protein
MATPRQIAANRSNARNSTGPTSDEGKDQSRSNSVKHGLAGNGVVLIGDDQGAIAQRLDSWKDAYPIHSEEDQWFFEQIVVNSVRIDRCQREESTLRIQLSMRADRYWDVDRGIAAEALGKTLPKNPSFVACKLRQTLQGCEWLLDRWVTLKDVLDRVGAWTEEHVSLVLDMLGTPHELRTIKPWSDSSQALTLVVEQIAALQAERAILVDLDALDHRAAVLSIDADLPRPLALQRRYESACMRRLQWARNCLSGKRGDSAPPEPRPLSQPQPVPEPEFVPDPPSAIPAEPPARDPDPDPEPIPEPDQPLLNAPEVLATERSAVLPPARWTRRAVDATPTTCANRKTRRAAQKLVACR